MKAAGEQLDGRVVLLPDGRQPQGRPVRLTALAQRWIEIHGQLHTWTRDSTIDLDETILHLYFLTHADWITETNGIFIALHTDVIVCQYPVWPKPMGIKYRPALELILCLPKMNTVDLFRKLKEAKLVVFK